jgi:hypothetical protein
MGAWQTVGQDLDIAAVESPLGDAPLPDHLALREDGRGFAFVHQGRCKLSVHARPASRPAVNR